MSCVAELHSTRAAAGAPAPQSFAAGSPRVLVAGATGFAGALAAHLLWRHPRFELVAVTGRSEVGRRLDDLYPRYRVPLQIEQLELDAYGELDAAIVAYPHAAAAPTVGDAARPRRARGRPERRLQALLARDLRSTGTASTRARICSRRPSTA